MEVTTLARRLRRELATARRTVIGPIIARRPANVSPSGTSNGTTASQVDPSSQTPNDSGIRSRKTHQPTATRTSPAERARAARSRSVSDRFIARTPSGTTIRPMPGRQDLERAEHAAEPHAWPRPPRGRRRHPRRTTQPGWPRCSTTASVRKRGPRSRCSRHHDVAMRGRGRTPDWITPTTAAIVADKPHARVSQKIDVWPAAAMRPSPGNNVQAQTRSFWKAFDPLPAAKNADRQPSWRRRPGNVNPSATKAGPIVPPRSRPSGMNPRPTIRPDQQHSPECRRTPSPPGVRRRSRCT